MNIITKPHKMHFSHAYRELGKCTFLKPCTMHFCTARTIVHWTVTGCMEARTLLNTPALTTLCEPPAVQQAAVLAQMGGQHLPPRSLFLLRLRCPHPVPGIPHPGARHVWRHALEQRTRPTVHQVLQHLVKSCGGSAEPPPEHRSGGWPACTPAEMGSTAF